MMYKEIPLDAFFLTAKRQVEDQTHSGWMSSRQPSLDTR